MRYPLLLVALAACPEPEPLIPTEAPVLRPVMELQPEALDFGEQRVGTSTVGRDVQIRNTGEDNLDVYEIRVGDPAEAFSVGTVGQAFRIPPGSARSFVVRFEPPVAGPFSSSILIVSNITPRGSEAAVPVEGVGVAAELEVVDQITVADPTEDQEIPVEIRNIGDVTLILESFEIDGNPGLGLDLDPDRNGVLPFELEPLNPQTNRPLRTIFVTWDPSVDDGSEEGTLTIASNDRTRATVTIPIRVGEP
ncbi:MAG: choice-of-anchor D domain-containing protein [Deltaproteobacteria bacterium]|nr:MAG: choice-of-anchor D domain-containing protein [Deltaproteobacteria bacterium]